MEEREARDVDDAERLAAEAREQVEKQAAELRRVKVPAETEPPAIFRP